MKSQYSQSELEWDKRKEISILSDKVYFADSFRLYAELGPFYE